MVNYDYEIVVVVVVVSGEPAFVPINNLGTSDDLVPSWQTGNTFIPSRPSSPTDERKLLVLIV